MQRFILSLFHVITLGRVRKRLAAASRTVSFAPSIVFGEKRVVTFSADARARAESVVRKRVPVLQQSASAIRTCVLPAERVPILRAGPLRLSVAAMTISA